MTKSSLKKFFDSSKVGDETGSFVLEKNFFPSFMIKALFSWLPSSEEFIFIFLAKASMESSEAVNWFLVRVLRSLLMVSTKFWDFRSVADPWYSMSSSCRGSAEKVKFPLF